MPDDAHLKKPVSQRDSLSEADLKELTEALRELEEISKASPQQYLSQAIRAIQDEQLVLRGNIQEKFASLELSTWVKKESRRRSRLHSAITLVLIAIGVGLVYLSAHFSLGIVPVLATQAILLWVFIKSGKKLLVCPACHHHLNFTGNASKHPCHCPNCGIELRDHVNKP